MRQFLNIINDVLTSGEQVGDRTGVGTVQVTGEFFRHDMRTGFPLLTTKKMAVRTCLTELEFFIKGIHDKRWLKERNCHIWDEWCSPAIVPYARDADTKSRMAEECELGPVYGSQWRNWGGTGRDQLASVLDTLKTDPLSRRMIVSSWNVVDIPAMALPPCHVMFQFISDGKFLDLIWYQRSADVCLGVPFNIASYGMLLTLAAAQLRMTPRWLCASFGCCHVYMNHLAGAKEWAERQPGPLPSVKVVGADSTGWTLFDWDSRTDWSLDGYDPLPAIKFPVAV